MSRRNNSVLEEFLHLASNFPWWVNVLLAFFSYIILHPFSDLSAGTITDPSQIFSQTQEQFLRVLALFGKIILPIVFLIAALASFIRNKRMKRTDHKEGPVTDFVKQDREQTFKEGPIFEFEPETKVTENFIRKLEWRSFEMLCYYIFSYLNKWEVDVNKGGADEGVDITLKDKESLRKIAIIQCKAFTKRNIPVGQIRELKGCMSDQSVKGGIFITTTTYTQDAIEFAKRNNIKLFTPEGLMKLYNQLPEPKQQQIYTMIKNSNYDTPTCVKCGVKMVKRKAKKGRNEGQYFWGCPNFPKCRSTMHYTRNRQ